MTHRPTRISRWLAVFGNTGYSALGRRQKRDRKPLLPEMLESRVLLTSQYVPNHVIVEIAPSPENKSTGEGPDAKDQLNLSKGIASLYPGAKLAPLGDYGLYLVSLPSNVDAMNAISRLRTLPNVKSAEPDWIGEWAAVPNDPNFNRMWGWQNSGQLVNGVTGINDADIDADVAWNSFTGSSTTKVAIVDSGVDYLHPDLAANIWSNPGEIAGNGLDDDSNGYVDDIHGYDFGSGDADPMDFVGHGTHVAGTVGAVGNNGIGTVGVNWNSSIMALKIGTDFGGPTNAGAIAAINYAVSMGAVVSNHSYTVNPTAALQSAIDNARANGHIVVVAAGNSSSNNDFSPVYPASYTQDNVVTVAATNQSDALASFSNYGAVSVDIAAPGVNIWSTTPRAGSLFYGANYDFSDGTSMAAPAVTGAIAFLRGISPNSTYTEIINVLYQGADVIPALVGRVSTGARLNLDRAARLLSPASISISPSTVSETAGVGAASITIRKDAFPIGTALVVNLTFDDNTEVNVPALAGGSSVTIPAGQTQITLPINIIDDTLLDGTQTVTFDLSLNGNSISKDFLRVTDVETLSMTVSPASVREDAGANAGTITVTRSNTDVAAPNSFSVVNNRLIEHNPAGVQVSNRSIPWPSGARPVGEIARDLVVMENGRIAVHNGTTTGYLSILNPANNTWQHILVPGLTSDPAVSGSGGISSSGDYVFLSDMSSSSADPFGVVRVDTVNQTVTRFANRSLGYRMFVKDVFGNNILEIDPQTGATKGSIPLPAALGTGSDFDNGMAFDGTSLWLTGGSRLPNSLYKIDPDDGTVLETHFVSTAVAGSWQGLAWLNNQLYLLSGGTSSIISAYDPVQRRVTSTLDIDSINSNVFIWKGLAGIQGPDRLVATTVLNDLVVEIDPRTGVITNQWQRNASAFPYGVGVANNEIYVGQLSGGLIEVYSRTGVLQRTLDAALASVESLAALGGDDVEGLVPTDYRYRDIDSGLDGAFYALDTAGVAVGRFNSTTLALDEFFNLAKPVNAIAVAADGTIWGAGNDGVLYHFSSTGVVIDQKTIGSISLVDIDLSASGQIMMTSSAGRVYRTNTSLIAPTSFSAGSSLAYGSFGRHHTLPTGDLLVQLTNSDPTEVSIPGSVVIPVGQRSVTVPLDAVDDSFFDGTQTVTFRASAAGYASVASASIDVLDAESVEVDIVAGSINENAGPGATQARIFRTDTDGPFTYVGPRQILRNSTSATILDYDKTNSYITVPQQTSRLTDVNVTLSLTHSFLSDLDIYLVSPSGTRVELVTDLVSNETEMTNTTFDDGARSSILTGENPFTGRFRPEGSLLDLNGESPAGVWTLEITDDNRTDFGTLDSWSLNLETVGLAALTVNLAKTDDRDEIGIPQSVVIPANQSEVFIPVDAIDDNLLDGTRVAGIRTSPTNTGYFSGSDKVNVLDREILQFTVDKSTVTETAGAGALIGKLVRTNSDRSASFTVSLTSSDISELTVPATVTIPAGLTTVTFPINAVDDAFFDGTQTVTIRAVSSQYVVDKNRVISVTDVEPKLVLSSTVSSVQENAGTFSVTVTRQQQSDISQPVTVNLSVSAFTGLSSPIRVPSTVRIPAGLTSQTFLVTVNDDRLLDGTQSATILATSPGITETSAEFTVTDYETLSLSINKPSVREDSGAAAARGTVTRSNLDNAFPLTVTLTSSDLTEIKVPTTVTIPVGASSVSFDIDAVNDPALDGTQTVTIRAAAAEYVGDSASINVDDHEPPVVTSPAATSVSPNPVVRWNPVPNALRYEVLLQNLSTGVEQLYNGILETRFTIEQPKAEPLGIGRYRVFVRAVDQLEQPGYWSVARDFRVITAPVFTAPSTTSSLVSGTFPEIAWTAVFDAAGDAAGYELYVHNLTTGKQNVIVQKNLTTTSYKATENLGSGSYRATVRAFRVFNGAREYGNFSTPLDFTVLAAPGMLTPVSGGTFDRSPVLSWSAVPGASTYDVIVQNSQTAEVVFRDRSVPGTNIRIPQDLSDATYNVRVRAQSGRFFGEWSAIRSFAVGASPEITSPAANAKAGAQPKFVWTSISGAERYEIWVLNQDTNAYVIQVDSLTGTSFTPSKKLPLGEYQVTVRAISLLGDITDWSDPVSFIGGTSPVISSPVNNATTTGRPAIVWSAVDGANAYNVRIVNLANNASVVLTGNLTGTSFTPSPSLAAGKYRIWVRAVSAQGHTSNWSTAVDVTVASSTTKEELTTSGTPVVASILPKQTADRSTVNTDTTQGRDYYSNKSVSIEMRNAVEQVSSTEANSDAEALAAATDYVMAAWDVSESWNAAPLVMSRRNEAL